MRRAFFFIVAVCLATSSFASIPRASMIDAPSTLRASLPETRIRVFEVVAPFACPVPTPLNRALHQAYAAAGTTNASGLSRFLSVDPVLDVRDATRSPQGWNRYAYVRNNPIRFTDPTGKYQCEGSRTDCAAIRNAYNDVRQARNNLPRGSSERRSLDRVLTFLGRPGQVNGVTVRVGAGTIPGAAGGASITQHAAPVGPTGFTSQIGLNLEGRSSPSFAPELASTLAHEAQHGMDQRAIGRMHENAAEVRSTETNAWTTDAAVYRGLNFESAWRTWTRAGGFDAEAVQRGVERSVQDWCNAGGNCQ